MTEEQNTFFLDWVQDFDLQAKSAEDQLAKDYHFLSNIAAGESSPILRLWCANPAIVVGMAEKRLPTFQHSVDDLAKKQWQVFARRTGGTAFVLTPQVLNISAIQLLPSKNLSIDRCYKDFCALLMLAFEDLGISSTLGFQDRAFCDGKFNVLVDNKKLVGTAQRWSRGKDQSFTAVLAQASIFVSINPKEISEIVNRFYQNAGSTNHYDADAIIGLNTALKSFNYQRDSHELTAKELMTRLAETIQTRFCNSYTTL